MIPRLIIILLLALGLLAQGLSMVTTLQDDPLRETSRPAAAPKTTRPPAMDKMSAFYPSPPARLPDLNEGYIFNEQRSLTEAGKEGKEQSLEDVDINTVQYSGSIITGATTKALLSYALRIRPTRKNSIAGHQNDGHLQVTVGDTVDGYKITEILPEKIVFLKGNDKIEKYLYDQDKKRLELKQPVPARPQSTKTPPPVPPRTPGMPPEIPPEMPPEMPPLHQMERQPLDNSPLPLPIPGNRPTSGMRRMI